MADRDQFSVDLTDAAGTLEISKQLWDRFCDDLKDDATKARVRLISGIQIAIRDGREKGWTDPIVYYKSS